MNIKHTNISSNFSHLISCQFIINLVRLKNYLIIIAKNLQKKKNNHLQNERLAPNLQQ